MIYILGVGEVDTDRFEAIARCIRLRQLERENAELQEEIRRLREERTRERNRRVEEEIDVEYWRWQQP